MTDDKCPCCGSDHTEWSLPDIPGDNTASKEESCCDCGADWVNHYQLVEQVILKGED